MGQQHAKGDVAAARIGLATIVRHEFSGTMPMTGSLEFEEATLVEEHRHRRGGDGFCDRGDVESVVCLINIPTLRLAQGRLLSKRARQGWGTLRSGLSCRAHFIREVAKCLECDYASIPWLTETEAAGKARVAIASFKTEKADEKMLS